MYKIHDLYKVNAAANKLMLSNYDADFWKEYRDNHTRYDKLFNRMFNSFRYFLQSDDETVDEVADNFREDVYNHLMINEKKYEELYRVQILPDEDYSLVNNYDMHEVMDKDVTDNQDNVYGQRIDNIDLLMGSRLDVGTTVKGTREDSTTNNIGEQTNTTGSQENTSTQSVAPYDSSTFANNTQTIDSLGSREDTSGAREDSITFTEGEQTDTIRNTKGEERDVTATTKGSQTDDLDRTYNEDYTLHRYGNIGVMTVTDMLQKHIKMWSLWDFYEYIFKEICKELLLI